MIYPRENILSALEKLAFKTVNPKGLSTNISGIFNPGKQVSDVGTTMAQSASNTATRINKKIQRKTQSQIPKVSDPKQSTAVGFIKKIQNKDSQTAENLSEGLNKNYKLI